MRLRNSGLPARLFATQLIVVAASLLGAVAVATLAGPPLFHEHLELAGIPGGSPELFHVEQAYRDANLITLAVALGTGLACALLASFLLSRTIRTPLEQLTAAAAEVAHGNYDVRVPVLGAGVELDSLARAFNMMADQLTRTEETRQRILSDLAHEMSTPVSVLSVYLEGLQDEVVEWNPTTDAVMAEQLARLTRLVEDIDDVSRAEEGRIDLDPAPLPLADLLETCAAAVRENYAAKGVTLTTAADADVLIADRQRLAQVLDNLLSNALRHTPPKGTVSLTATGTSDTVLIRVTDTGDGMTADQLTHIFERFYRGDTARDRDHGGSGIGLTISHALIAAHGGTLTASSAGPGHGSEFTIELPRTPGKAYP
ncbi:sensor histidine kinase [Parenemella sanctibonifatiensis]|uniref:histidine kinase n=1 Tax=Parenemella sanctibonifatiensis TaxID=2016505 RepID=A0A255EDI3_9ACTN|nr:ATP-binding protein [Parenemella sanctibonifatiensis]OYN87472.1 two-component sensor histidine kinase [Parenemella sanctibonifatiensis]